MKLFYTLEGATPGDGGNSLVVAGCWQRFKGRSESARRVTAAILCTSVSILQRPKVQCVANITENEMFVSQGRTQGGVLGLTPPLNLLSYENVITYAKEFVYVFVHFLLVWCQLNAKTIEWFFMKISRNTVNGPKRNNYILVGIWVIACIQEPCHHFLQTSSRLRIFMLVLRNSSLYS